MPDLSRERPRVVQQSVAVTTSGDAVRLRSLLDIAKVVGAARRFDDLIELTAEEARRALDAASLSITRWEGEQGAAPGPGQRRRARAGRGPVPQRRGLPGDPASPRRTRWSSSGRATSPPWTTATRRPRCSPRSARTRSLGVPIVVDARVWGALYATRLAGQPRFGPADLDFAAAVATHVAAGVVQADHFARIERLAFQDPLTGLANRRAVDDRLEDEMAPGTDRTFPVSVVLADINRLKQVNDSFGHEAGDRLIAAVGQAVSRASGLVPGSLAARIGGDEFCIVVTGAPGASAVAGRRGGVPPGRRPADEHRRLLRGRLHRLARRARRHAGAAAPAGRRRAVPRQAGRAALAGGGRPGGGRRERRPVRHDRRRRRGRSRRAVPETLESGLALLDALHGADAQTRLEAVADHVLHLVDAGGWWVSEAPGGGPDLIIGGQLGAALRRPVRRAAGRAGEDRRRLRPRATSRPPSARCATPRSFAVELGVHGNDPDEESALVIAGYRAVHRRRRDRGRHRLAGRGLRRHHDPAAGRLRAGAARPRGGRRRGRRPTRRSRSAYRLLVRVEAPGPTTLVAGDGR